MQKAWSASCRHPLALSRPTSHPPLHLCSKLTSFDIFFWRNCPNEMWNQHKNKFLRESYFFMFISLQNNVTWFFISNTFIRSKKIQFCYQLHAKMIMGRPTQLFIYLFNYFIHLFILTEEKNINHELKRPSINQFKRGKTKY